MATRRVNPRLVAALQGASIEPLSFDSPGRVVEVPVPREHFGRPEQPAPQKSRFDVIREHLESTRQQTPAPSIPEPDMRAAVEADAWNNFSASMSAASAAFLGNRRAVEHLPQSNTHEMQALAQRDARRKALEEWAAGRERQRMGEAGLLGQALSADEAAAQREAQLGVQKDRVALERDKVAIGDGNADADRELRAKRGAAPKAPKLGQTFKDVSALRKEFNALPEVKSFKEAATSFEKIQRAAASPSAAGDLSLIFAYMKVLDPGSTVREGEFAAAAAAAGTDQRLLGALEKVRSGQKLTPEQRADFVARAKDLYAAQRRQYDTQAALYRRLAEKQGADPDDIVGGATDASDGGPTLKPPSGKVPMVSVTTGATVFLSPAAAATMEKAGKVKRP